MCMHIFSPGKSIQLDYVAESIILARGGSTDLLDILLTNHTADRSVIDRIHLVYPHAIPAGLSAKSAGKRDIKDHTVTWCNTSSHFNRFYQTDEIRLKINNDGGVDEISVEMPDPNDITKTLSYNGRLQGRRFLTVYQIGGEGTRLTVVQWDILSQLGWSVFTIHFERPLEFEQARWLRLQCRNGIIHQNEMVPLEYWPKKMCGLVTHTFEIAGPKDVEHRIISALKAAGTVTEGKVAYADYREELLDLQEKLLSHGIEARNTTTVIQDWRINVFTDYYRRIDEPTFWGDIKPAGGLSNPIKDKDGTIETVLQWKAGDSIVGCQNKGLFGARIRAHDIPFIVPLLPWIALSLACLLNSDKICKFFLWIWSFF